MLTARLDLVKTHAETLLQVKSHFKDETNDDRKTGLPTMTQPLDELAFRLETGIVPHDIKRQEHNALEDINLGDDIKEGETNGFDNQNAMKCKPREKDSHVESILNLHMMTIDRHGEDTKVLEFVPGRKPEVVKI